MGFSLKKYSAGKWLGGKDFEKGERKTLTITDLIEHEFEDGKTRPVLKFAEIEQWLSLNKTRNDKVMELFGEDADDVIGKKIVAYADDIRFGGKPEKTVVIAAYRERQPVLDPDEEFMKDLDR